MGAAALPRGDVDADGLSIFGGRPQRPPPDASRDNRRSRVSGRQRETPSPPGRGRADARRTCSRSKGTPRYRPRRQAWRLLDDLAKARIVRFAVEEPVRLARRSRRRTAKAWEQASFAIGGELESLSATYPTTGSGSLRRRGPPWATSAGAPRDSARASSSGPFSAYPALA